jgi:phospholipase/carboxylesterase
VVLLVALLASACAGSALDLEAERPSPPAQPTTLEGTADSSDRLGADPSPPVEADAPTGLHELPDAGDGSLLYVPKSYRPGKPMPFALTLHGCCSEARGGLNLWFRLAKRNGIILLAPDGGGSWSGAEGRIDDGLQEVFSRYAVDPGHIAVVGFSAGAGYALTLGLANGDLFTHVVAHSPGGFYQAAPQGEPFIFIAHGTDDQTIPIDASSRQIVPDLRKDGYQVRYVEYPAGHRPQPHIMQRAVAWFLD